MSLLMDALMLEPPDWRVQWLLIVQPTRQAHPVGSLCNRSPWALLVFAGLQFIRLAWRQNRKEGITP